MLDLKAIQTQYNGYLFRSRLEARWAVFFDACGVKFEYEPEGYDLGNGLMYLPDFLLHGVVGRDSGDLFVEVKVTMNQADAEKIKRFAEIGKNHRLPNEKFNPAILVVGQIPKGSCMGAITACIGSRAYADQHGWPNEFNFETIDGDYFAAHPGVNLSGGFELFGDDSGYLCEMDEIKTEKAYRLARQARFEHGLIPHAAHRLQQN